MPERAGAPHANFALRRGAVTPFTTVDPSGTPALHIDMACLLLPLV